MELGDLISNGLSKIGITEKKVSTWLGKPCGCHERRQKLNTLSRWAKQVLRGKLTKREAKQRLNEITEE